MPKIKAIPDRRNYSEVLYDVSVDAPLFLTKNGRGAMRSCIFTIMRRRKRR